jgi:putative RNA 2'-phosphotransferase
MARDREVHLSKLLSLVLRHRPQTLGLTLDDAGWVDVELLLHACAAHGKAMTRAELDELVRANDKQRFAFSSDGTRIRASQGHSLPVALGYEAATPPPLLYHGTVARFIAAIREQGLRPGERQLVHLSADVATAKSVGARRGRPIVLTVSAREMASEGFLFQRSANGVWLTEAVPPRFIAFP